jgi:hypothetical protein
MHWHHWLRTGVRPLMCVVAIASFLALGAPAIFRSAARSSIKFAGPFHSSDSFLGFATGVNNGSERLIAFFGSLPSSNEILIVVRDDDQRSAFLGMLVAYLAWPHPVRIVDLRNGGTPRSAELETIAAVAFCRVQPPPPWRRGEWVGDSLEIVPTRERK